ncbi:peptide ABC transporter substrate-binding protein [Clostridium neuense]|uniref:Peptide ABC transporter substrate-binding protein n=1 Tax=Clostridium neuense TaxID=1728934 RepID=A0ABW8TKK1_9CLOT
MNKLYKVIINTIIICLMFTGCVEKKTKEFQTSVKNNSITYAIGTVPESLTASQDRNVKTNEFLKALFSGLVYEDDKTMEIKPGLAERWEVSKDKMQYTFHIRDNAMWSDGQKITAQDFYVFFKEMLSPQTNNVNVYDLRYIYGEEAYNSGKTSFDKVAINAIDDNTLIIRLNSPCDYFLSILSEPQFFLREINRNTDKWQENYLKIKYSGPFRITYVSQGLITLKKNSNYFMKDSVKSNELKLKFYNDGENASAYSVTDFDSNSIDIFSNPPTTEINRLKQSNHVKNFSTLSIYALSFNMNKVSDINFRKAINLLTSRNKLVQNMPKETISPIYNFVPSSIRQNYIGANMFKDAVPLEGFEDLKKSGYDSDNKILLVYEEGTFNRKICENYIDSINKNIQTVDKNKKINFELKGYNKSNLCKILKNGDYDMFLGEYNISFNNPMSFLEMFSSKSPFNLNKYSSVVYDNLIYSMINSNNANKSSEYYYKAIKQLVDDLPVIPMCIKNNIVCMSPIISELNQNPYGEIIISSIK